MARIYEVSGGNPFYAIEIARALGTHSPVGEVSLPRTLLEVVQSRLGSLESSVRNALLAMACLTSATTGDIFRVTGIDPDQLIELRRLGLSRGVAGQSRRRTDHAAAPPEYG
jgi:hypothetical protein